MGRLIDASSYHLAENFPIGSHIISIFAAVSLRDEAYQPRLRRKPLDFRWIRKLSFSCWGKTDYYGENETIGRGSNSSAVFFRISVLYRQLLLRLLTEGMEEYEFCQ